MASFKICVRNRRKDGLWPVYLRLVHDRKVAYIRTELLVSDAGLSKDREIKDTFVLKRCMEIIEDFAERINRRGVEGWDALRIKQFLADRSTGRSFSDFAESFIRRMERAGSIANAKIYRASMKALKRYLNTEDIDFELLTRESINGWIAHLSKTKRARTLYPVCVRLIFKEAVLVSQDPGSSITPITYNPWDHVTIPASETPRKRAVSSAMCRRFFKFEIPASGKGVRKAQLGRDVAELSFCLAAMNTVDLYKLRKGDLKDGVLRYCRSKTASRRRDGAYFEMRVTQQAQRLIDRYRSDDDDDLLLKFGKTYSSAQSFVAYVDGGIAAVCEMMGMPKSDFLTFYSFRHSWATIARNECGASLSEVGFAMNHLQSDGVTRGYIKPDFTPAWELNEKVMDVVFETVPTQRPSKSTGDAKTTDSIGLTPETLLRIAVFHQGKCLLNYQDIGFSYLDDILLDLSGRLPAGLATADVKIKIVNCDNGKVYVYEPHKEG